MIRFPMVVTAAGQFVGRLAVAAVQVFVLAALIWNFLRLYPGDRWLVVRLGSYFTPWLLMGLTLLLPVTLLTRRVWLVGATLAALLLIGGRYSHLLLPRTQTVSAEASASTLKVMTFNVHYSNRNAGEIARLVQTEKPDIIALQEYNAALDQLLSPQLQGDYPYQIVNDFDRLSLAVFSRYPLSAHPTSPAAKRVQHLSIDLTDGPITFWNIHPAPALGEGGWQFQRTTMTAIRAELEQVTGPLIVVGDFNTTDQSENFQLIAQGLTNAYHVAGRGFGFTFPDPDLSVRLPGFWRLIWPPTPVVGIDHILVSQHFDPVETHIYPGGVGSDHRPVMATLRLER